MSSKEHQSLLSQIWFIVRFSVSFFWSTSPKLFLGIVFLNAVASLLIVPNLYLDKLFIDTLVANVGKPDLSAAFQIIMLIVAGRLGLALSRSLSSRLSGFFARKFFWKNFSRLEVVVGTKYATIGVPTFEDPAFKDRYNRLEREGLHRVQIVGESLVRIPQYLFGMIASLSFFVASQPLIILFSLVSLLPSIFIDRIFIKKDYQLDQEITALHRKRGMYYYYLGRCRSYLESRILNNHKYYASRISEYWQQITSKRLGLLKSWRTWDFMADIVDSSVSYSFDAVFSIQAIMGKITIGSAQAYIRAISSFKSSVSDFASSVMSLYENYYYLSDLDWFLKLDSPYYNDNGQKLAHVPEKIEFKDVWFKYPGTQNWILKGVSFTINPAENVALVGKNGAGKTTLVKLLCGFYAPVKGEICINGVHVSGLNKPDLWQHLGVLFQDTDQFGITVREMIAASNVSKMSDTASIKKYAQATEIDEWINSLPLKYDNPIGRDFEKGVMPSSGQMQKLVIARAMFKDPALLILDEPTSNIDPQAEENIFNRLLEYGQDKIILFISHRFSTVRRADRILVLEEGKITEQGTHEQLLKKQLTYSKLFKLQAASYK